MTNDDLQERLIEFAVRIIRLCGALPKSQAGQHIGAELLRSGTTPAPHYAAGLVNNREAFADYLKLSLRALQETRVWLKIIRKSEMLPVYTLDDVMTEGEQLAHRLRDQLAGLP